MEGEGGGGGGRGGGFYEVRREAASYSVHGLDRCTTCTCTSTSVHFYEQIAYRVNTKAGINSERCWLKG